MTSHRTGLGARHLAVGAALILLGAAIALAVTRETVPSAPATSTLAPTSQQATPPAAPAKAPRPALTADEENYIRALWPIHGEVQRHAMRITLGQILYKTQDLPRTELGVRVGDALTAFQDAEARLRALQPPASLRTDHATYLDGVRLFKESATEVRKMFADGSDDHMLAAYPRSQEASDKIRDVGGKLWPHEFPPH